MTLPSLSTLKTWGLAFLAGLVAVLAILLQSERLGRTKDKLKIAKAVNKTQAKATEAIVKGQEKIQEVQNETIDTKHRTGLD